MGMRKAMMIAGAASMLLENPILPKAPRIKGEWIEPVPLKDPVDRRKAKAARKARRVERSRRK